MAHKQVTRSPVPEVIEETQVQTATQPVSQKDGWDQKTGRPQDPVRL